MPYTYTGFDCWPAASQGARTKQLASRAELAIGHQPASSKQQQPAAGSSRQQASQQIAEGSAPRSHQQPAASSSQKLSTATQPRAKQGITRSASFSPGENPVPSGIHVACTGTCIRHQPGRHPSDKQATKQRQKQTRNQRPGRTRKLGRKFQGFFAIR